jgi:SAM-dependent methyltransferase
MCNPRILSLLVCPYCKSKVQRNRALLTCTGCNRKFKIVDNIPIMISQEDYRPYAQQEKQWLEQLKAFIKRKPRFYSLLIDWVSPILHTKKERAIIALLTDKPVVLNLGCGTRRLGPQVINLDIFPLREVDIVCDISRLPFEDSSVDGVICEMVLEHTKSPQSILSEMKRVLKKDGLVYIAVPFLVGYHSSPHDYYRWTLQGIEESLSSFQKIEVGIRGGPTSALCWLLQEWLALVFSFNIKFLYRFFYLLFALLTFPLKYLDLILGRYSSSSNIASGFYFLGKRSSR